MPKLIAFLVALFLTINVYNVKSVFANSTGPVKQVDAGAFHNIVVKSDGTVMAWGNEGWSGQTSAPEGLRDIKSVSAGNRFSIVLKNDGTVTGWGDQNQTSWQPPGGLNNVIAIAAGGRHSLALKSDGTVLGWGDNSDGQAAPPAGLKNVIKIAAGQYHSLALKSDGTVAAWGDNYYGQTNVPSSLSNVKEVAGGDQYSMALKNDGTVVVWGTTTELQPPKGLSGVTEIAAGAFHALALKKDGTVVQWGSFTADPPPDNLKDVKAISAGRYHSIALLSDGTLNTWEDEQSSIPVSLRHKSSNASLSSIVIDSPITTLNPSFTKDQTMYKLDIPTNVTTMMLHSFTEDRYATVKRYFPNGDSAPPLEIPLENGPTTVQFIVTAEDGVTTKKYIVTANQVLEHSEMTVQKDYTKATINLSISDALTQIRQAKEIDIFRINLDKELIQPIINIIVPAEVVAELKLKSNQIKMQINTAAGSVEIPIESYKNSEAAVIQLRKKQITNLGSFFLPGLKRYEEKYLIVKPYSVRKLTKSYKK
jgi:hypothetical protein